MMSTAHFPAVGTGLPTTYTLPAGSPGPPQSGYPISPAVTNAAIYSTGFDPILGTYPSRLSAPVQYVDPMSYQVRQSAPYSTYTVPYPPQYPPPMLDAEVEEDEEEEEEENEEGYEEARAAAEAQFRAEEEMEAEEQYHRELQAQGWGRGLAQDPSPLDSHQAAEGWDDGGEVEGRQGHRFEQSAATATALPVPSEAKRGEADVSNDLWDSEWSVTIFLVGACCIPPVLLYNLLYCHSASTTARIFARISQMVFIFYAIVFVMIMAVITATDSW